MLSANQGEPDLPIKTDRLGEGDPKVLEASGSARTLQPLIQAPHQHVDAMNNWFAKQTPPCHQRIDMHGVVIAGKLGKRQLIRECEYAGFHVMLWVWLTSPSASPSSSKRRRIGGLMVPSRTSRQPSAIWLQMKVSMVESGSVMGTSQRRILHISLICSVVLAKKMRVAAK